MKDILDYNPKSHIIVKGAYLHNLRQIDVAIPRNKLTVITGLSGSGKSSLAFDTLYAEGQRRYVESLSSYARQFMGRLDKHNRKYLAEILFGFIERDYVKVAEIHFLAGLVPPNTSKDDLAQALRSIGEPIFGQSIKDISGGNLLGQLFEITEKFNMATQPPLLLLQKTMVVVEGVARKLYPDTNIWEVSKPVLENWLKNIKSPKTTLDTAVKTSSEIIKRIPDLPDFIDRADYALKLMAEGKLSLAVGANKNLEMEQMKLKNFRNNIIISFFGIVIVFLLVF